MLTEAAVFINENPIIIIIGFLSSIVGLFEIIGSAVLSRKTKKEKVDIESKIKEMYQLIHNKSTYDVTSDEIEKKKQELDNLQKQIEIDIPKVYKDAELRERIRCEEHIIREANIRINKLKDQLEEDNQQKTADSFFHNFSRFITSENAKDIILLLLFLAAATYFVGLLFGNFFAKIVSIGGIWLVFSYAREKYTVLKSEQGDKIINGCINVGITFYFFEILLWQDGMQLIIWALIILLLSFLRKKTNILLDIICPFLAIPCLIAALVFTEYEMVFLMIMMALQAILMIVNIIILYKEGKALFK